MITALTFLIWALHDYFFNEDLLMQSLENGEFMGFIFAFIILSIYITSIVYAIKTDRAIIKKLTKE